MSFKEKVVRHFILYNPVFTDSTTTTLIIIIIIIIITFIALIETTRKTREYYISSPALIKTS